MSFFHPVNTPDTFQSILARNVNALAREYGSDWQNNSNAMSIYQNALSTIPTDMTWEANHPHQAPAPSPPPSYATHYLPDTPSAVAAMNSPPMNAPQAPAYQQNWQQWQNGPQGIGTLPQGTPPPWLQRSGISSLGH